MNTTVFIDTNILLSSFILPVGNCRLCLEAITTTDAWSAVTSAYVFEELFNQTKKERFNKRFSRAALVEYVTLLVDLIPIVNPAEVAQSIRTHTSLSQEVSPRDLHIWAAFNAVKADYLLTGNTKDFPQSNSVVTPREFLHILA